MLARAGICALALVVAAPAAASAQFTTVIRPPERQEAPAIAQAQQAKTDSLATLQITSMQQWVDSVSAAAAETGDTIVAVESGGAVETDSAAIGGSERESTVRYADGAPAPDTATPLPLLTLLGFLAAGTGAALLHRARA